MTTYAKPSTRTVEDLKSEGLYFTAGAMLFQLGYDRSYGCHYGMRSDLDASREEFYRGYDAAAHAAKPQRLVVKRNADGGTYLARAN